MNVLYSLLCEHAHAREDDGRLDVHGVFHQLYAPGFPAQQDRLTVAVALEWDAGEEGRVDFRVDLVDPSDSPALTISGHTDVGPRQEGEAPPQTRLIMPLENIVFPVVGTYRFVLQIGEDRRVLAPIHLIQDPNAR